MTNVVLAQSPISDFYTSGAPTLGGKIFIYAAGTTNKITTYTDQTGSVTQTNPIITNARGEPENVSGASVGIWIPPGTNYKMVFTSPTDTDPPTSPIWTVDNLYAAPTGVFTGDSGTGGAAGLVPAPPAGSAATNWVLGAGGSWGAIVYTSQAGGTILANITGGSATPTAVTYAQFAAAMGGNSATTFALGNDSRFKGIEQSVRTGGGSYTLLIGDAGAEQYFTTLNCTLNIPSNASVPFPVGTVIPVRCPAGITVTISISTDTLIWVPSGSTGTRTLTGPGYTVLEKVTATVWNVGAGGLT